MLLAFAGVAALTLLGSGVALVSYGHVNGAFERVTGDGLPAITQSLRLAREAAEDTAIAPVLLAADSPDALEAARATVVDKSRGMKILLGRLEETSVGSGAAERLADALKALESHMSLLGSAIAKRLATTGARDQATAAALKAHQAIADKIVPLIDDASFNLIIGLENAGDTRSTSLMAASIAKLAETDARALLSLSDLRAESNLLIGLLSEASVAPKPEHLAPLRDRYTASGTRAAKAVAGLKAFPEASDLKKGLDALLAVGQGAESIFDLRRQELAATAQGSQALQATRTAAATLTGEVSALVARAHAASDSAVAVSDGAVGRARAVLVAIALLSIALAGVAWLYVGRGVVARLKRLNGSMLALAEGDLSVAVPHDGRDELSAMADAVEVFKQHAVTTRKLEAEQRKSQEQRDARHDIVEGHIRRFDDKIGVLLQGLGSASRQMSAVATAMASAADEASHQATAVASASGEATESVRSVAAAAEEISVTVREISQQITQSSNIAGRAVVEAERTDAIVRGLADAASKIGEVVQLIQAIAGQTNLLALNATIEAARAGEAGRGFAVVASEVKALATQTGKATEEIAAQIAAIQGATREAVQAIQAIGTTIGDISRISISIAAAMDQQGATTAEIARSTLHAAGGTQQVSRSIEVVSEATAKTGAAADEVLQAATDLNGKADELRAEVDQFLGQIRAA
ncbi:MAG TPA: methyl-accepting chemotaxis protein [Beijerinckiaceae bacterium]|nr:methyl-accepting chemotaxis protein [Beijerinckiaceae bacterium]